MRTLVLGFLVALIAMPLHPAAAAESVTVRGGLHEGYGRIVFDWPRRVDYDARVEEDRLVLSFGVAADFEGRVMRDGLSGYTAAPQASGEGRVLTLPLSKPYGLKHFRVDNKVVVDLQQNAGPPRNEPPLRADLPRVRVRGGQHNGFSRLVFDWGQPVGNVVEEVPGSARIVFDRRAAFDTAGLRLDRLGQIAGVSVTEDSATVDMPEGGRVKVSRAGTRVVLDVFAPETASRSLPASGSETPSGPEKAPARAQAAPEVVDLSPRPEAPPPAEKSTEQPAENSTAGPTSLVPKAMGGAAASAPRSASPAQSAARSQAATGPRKAARPEPALPEAGQREAGAGVPAVQLSETPKPAKRAAAATKPTPATKAAKQTPAASAADPGKVTSVVADSARGDFSIRTEPLPSFITSRAQGPKAEAFVPVVMTFTWERPTAAAAFRRGENLWLVFDRPAPRGVVERIAAAAPYLGDVQLMEDNGSTILVIGANPTVVPRLSREDGQWTVDLRPRSPLPERGLAAPVIETPKDDNGGSRVRFPVIGAGRLLWVTDPDAGDRLVLVPVRGAGMGLTLPYGFPQFRSLQSQQGIILQPLTPGIQVATTHNGVLVRDREGLLVSKAEERRGARHAATPLSLAPGLFDLAAWRRGGVEDFQKNRHALQQAMRGLQGERLGIARLDLARFFFAHGFDSEALGVLEVIEAENPRLAQDPEVRLMKGASQVMLQDYRGAAASLAHPALTGEREALLWQAALAAQAEDWQAAATGFAATLDLIDSYPDSLRFGLGLAAADSFLHAGDMEAATIQLGTLLRNQPDERETAQLKIIQGGLQLAQNETERARQLWTEARDGPHRPTQARARLALIDLGLQEETLSVPAAIAELERLRFAWRGDLFEFTLLRKLADLYVQETRHRDALYALREAVTNFPDGAAVRNAAQRMREIFAEVFRGPGDPDVPPLRALALYQEFMELTPVGPEGDRMIAGLADRLVEVDLLDRAAELLEGQVHYRLEGEEKARIGARLALVRLLDRTPEAALDALQMSEVDGLEDSLRKQRRKLRARALSDVGRSDEALKMLQGDDSLDAEKLRADIHWRQRQWPSAVVSLSKLIPLLPPRRALEEKESQLVVNLAVALMLSDQAVELEDLNRRYGAAMARGPHAETFKLLVGDGERVTIPSIADELAKVSEAQDFMANYRERLRDGTLSQLN